MNISFVPILAFLWPYVERLLNRFANNLWDEMWKEIAIAVKAAEEKWKASGQGDAKKSEVVGAVMTFISSRAKLNILQMMLIKIFVNIVVDALIDTFNKEMGKDWVAHVQDIEKLLAEKLPIIE